MGALLALTSAVCYGFAGGMPRRGGGTLIPYLLADQRQLSAIAVVLASRYPALPVVLGFVLQREPLTARRVIRLTGAAATVLLTLG